MNFCGLGLGSFSKSGSRILRGSVARIWLTMRVNYVYVHIGLPRQRRHIAISKPLRRALQVAFVDIERIYPTHLVWGCSLARLRGVLLLSAAATAALETSEFLNHNERSLLP